MTTDKAIDRIGKLREITVARGATAHEAATATALAGQISARFGLDRPAVEIARPAVLRPQVARYARSVPTDRRASRSLRFVAFG
jgi:lactate dehydrogenase-like 2-hydroxyacid dehydrogenase